MRLSKAQTLLLSRIREMQPVSEARLGILKGPAKKTFQALVQKGLIIQAGNGMLGINWKTIELDKPQEG
jgi:hypothetical protein